MRRTAQTIAHTWLIVALTACAPPPPSRAPTPPPYTALFVVTNGPYPLYAEYGDWLGERALGLSLADSDERTMNSGRIARAHNQLDAEAGPWLHRGCIFDVQSTTADQQDGSYTWAYGRVVRCDEPLVNGPPEPQMGVRPRQLLIYDGWLGYFPMRLLEPYTGSPPTARQ